MLIRLGFLIVFQVVDDVRLPCITSESAVATNLVKHIVQVVKSINNLTDISFLERSNRGDGECKCFSTDAIGVGISVDAIDIVIAIKWIGILRIVLSGLLLRMR